LSLDDQGIVDLLESYDKESKAIKRNALQISWFMRGGLTYSDVLALSYQERVDVEKIIKDNMETTKKSGMPFF
jgi:hypothetical protein